MANDFTMLDLPSWITNPKQWNKPTLGNFILPGIVTLKEAKQELKVEKNGASGKKGGGATIKGGEQPDFTFELVVYSAKEEKQWNDLVKVLLPPKNPKDAPAFYVQHPSLARMNIFACMILGVKETPPHAGGPLMATIHCQSVLPSKPNATKKVTSRNASVPNSTSPDAISIQYKTPRAQLNPQLDRESPKQQLATKVFASKAINPNKR